MDDFDIKMLGKEIFGYIVNMNANIIDIFERIAQKYA